MDLKSKAINYEKRLVFYMDILGFSNCVKKSENDNNMLIKIVGALNLIFKEKIIARKNNEKCENFSYQISTFSDCIIISVPINEDCEIIYAIVSIEYMLRDLIYYGFLARGGISVGKMYHDGDIAFGPALVNAVFLEEQIAKYPRIIMDESTYKTILQIIKQNNGYSYEQDKKIFDSLLDTFTNNNNENFYYLDFISQYEEYYGIEEQFKILLKNCKLIIKNFNNLDSHVNEKYIWFESYLKKTCEKFSIDYDKL